MALHQLTSFTLGVPNLAETAAYYREFGLAGEDDGWLATRDGGRQLRLVSAPTRRLIELRHFALATCLTPGHALCIHLPRNLHDPIPDPVTVVRHNSRGHDHL